MLHAVHFGSMVIILVDQTKKDTLKMHRNKENACVNRMWEIGFKQNGKIIFSVCLNWPRRRPRPHFDHCHRHDRHV